MRESNGHPTHGAPDLLLRGERCRRPLDAATFHILTQLTAPIVPDPANRRPPLNLAFVVDRSGSMAGGALELAKRGVEHALRTLDERDRAAVVVYDDRVDTLLSPRRVDQEARDKATRRLRRIEARGSTDLASGWLAGCDELARLADSSGDPQGGALCRVVLLTDGLANVGLTDPANLAQHARELQLRGISTSTFGVGDHFDEQLLAQLADAGSGRYHHIPHARTIPNVFAGELGELLRIALRDTTLSIRVPTSWQVSLLNDLPLEHHDGWLILRLGELASGEAKALVWQVEMPSALAGAGDTVEVAVRWRDATGTHTFEHNVCHTFEASAEPCDADERVQDEVALLLGARARAEAVAYNRVGQYDRARDAMQQAANAIPRTAAGLAEAHDLLKTGRMAAAPMSPADLKEQHALAYRRRRSRRDYTEPER